MAVVVAVVVVEVGVEVEVEVRVEVRVEVEVEVGAEEDNREAVVAVGGLNMITLLPHQVPHARRLMEALCDPGNVALDTSSTGTGKTYTALHVAQEFKIEQLLVVCPLAAIPEWEAAAKIAGIEPNIIHYQGLLAAAKRNREGKGPAVWGGWARYRQKWQWHGPIIEAASPMMIFDEAHRLTGLDSQISKMLMACRDQEIPTLMLSATPFYSPLKMRAMAYRFGLTPNPLKSTFTGWCLMHGCYYGNFNQLTFDEDSQKTLWPQVLEECGGRIFGVNKEEVEGFPECQTVTRLVPTTEPIDDYYGELEVLEAEAELPVVKIMRLRQKIEWAKAKNLVEMAKDLMAQGYSVPIFVSFRATAEKLAEKLKCTQVTGGTAVRDRPGIIQDFQHNKVNCMVLTMDAGAQSISLHDLHGRPRASLICPGWDSTMLVQALGRVHRAGARSKAMNNIILAAGSAVEKRVAELLRHKLTALEEITQSDLGSRILLDAQSESE